MILTRTSIKCAGINKVFSLNSNFPFSKPRMSPAQHETAAETYKGNFWNCFSTRELRKVKCSRVDTRVFQNLLKNTIGSSLNKTSLLRIVTITSFEQNINITACKNSDHSWTSSLPAPVAFRETPLGPRAKKDGCFPRLTTLSLCIHFAWGCEYKYDANSWKYNYICLVYRLALSFLNAWKRRT